jgi:uncharacterized repeat protein (TIGR01451 family)
VTVTVANQADLAVSKDVDDVTPGEGDTIVYTLQVTNNGPISATGVVISDTLPGGVTHVANDGSGAYDDASGAWDVGSLAVAFSDTLHITATVDAGTAGATITNTAVISRSNQPDPVTGNNTDDAAITVASPTDADLAVSKDVDNATPGGGDTIVYTLQVTNNGPALATGVVISDTLPGGVTYAADDGGDDYDHTTGAWDVGSLAVGLSDTLHITATVSAGTLGITITNTAMIGASDQPDPVPDNNADDAAITVSGVKVYLPLVLRNF